MLSPESISGIRYLKLSVIVFMVSGWMASSLIAKTILGSRLIHSSFFLTHEAHLFTPLIDKSPIREGWNIFRYLNCSTLCPTEGESVATASDCLNDSKDLFRRWGCTDEDVAMIFMRRPSLRNADPNQLERKLSFLKDLGITSPDLVKIIHCRPRFLSCRINNNFAERIELLTTLFDSKPLLVKAIVRNPSLLMYDVHHEIKPAIALYKEMGVSKKDLILMLLTRPTLIPRTSFDDEKVEYIRKTGVSNDAPMYKYVVTIIGISRLETIRRKVANLEKFGFTEDEVFHLIGRSPLILTLSVDKVQRNMTFILCSLKMPANVVIQHPFLLYANLETVLKPRLKLSMKMQEMDLNLQITSREMLRALRMTEKRFLKAFVRSQPKEVEEELIEFYTSAKEIKKLAETSKKNLCRGFPF